jgi:hypothetical protein
MIIPGQDRLLELVAPDQVNDLLQFRYVTEPLDDHLAHFPRFWPKIK